MYSLPAPNSKSSTLYQLSLSFSKQNPLLIYSGILYTIFTFPMHDTILQE